MSKRISDGSRAPYQYSIGRRYWVYRILASARHYLQSWHQLYICAASCSIRTMLEEVQVAHPGCKVVSYRIESHSHPSAVAHLRMSRWPLLAARLHVSEFHQGHPLAFAHFRTSRWPSSAAEEHVSSSQGQPLVRSHLRTSRRPPSAAEAHVSSFHSKPLARIHLRTSRWPLKAAEAHAF